MTTNQTIDGVDRKIQEGELVMSTERIRKEFEVFRKEAIAAFARIGLPNPDRCIRDTASLWSGWQAGWKACQAAIETRKTPGHKPVAWLAQAVGKGGEVYRNKASTIEPTMRDIEIAWGQGVIDRFTIVIKPLYAEQPAPVAPTPINYGALDPVERLAVCRGEVAPVAVVMPERLQQVLKFLDGSENLDGHWFGEPHPSGRQYWWCNELRKALAETNLFATQQ
ncbi:hypothetical protein [Pseudomonas sivasensis]|uniref:Uncharacterized protein n=1 Tax=Pseudomonas sivasensis TaxID=1880678 RepID=A0ABW8E6M0_9PSED